MSWLFFGVVAVGVIGWLMTRDRPSAEAFEATVTHVEVELQRGRVASATKDVVRVTYARDDGEDGSFVFDPKSPELRYSFLPRVAVGDRLVKDATDPMPRRLPEVGVSSYAAMPLSWEHTGDVDAPYAAEHDGVALVLEVNPYRGPYGLYVFADGSLEGGVVGWPEPWRRPEDG